MGAENRWLRRILYGNFGARILIFSRDRNAHGLGVCIESRIFIRRVMPVAGACRLGAGDRHGDSR